MIVVEKRHITDEALDTCAEEPIRIPGAIQPHGLLLALRSGSLEIEQVSDNAEALIGHRPGELLSRPFLEVVNAGHRDSVRRLVAEAAGNYVNPFEVVVDRADGGTERFEGIAHVLGQDITVLELEKVVAESSRGDRLDDYFQLIQRSLQESQQSRSVEEMCGLIVREVKEFTGFDRVMVYRFHPDAHGEVVAEALEPGMEPYLNLHYPASDIPPQARKLYEENWVRLLRDRGAVPAALQPAMHPRTGEPLDLSGAVLRAMSPVHLEYLANMGVGASLTISLLSQGKLWGLIACHHRTPRFVTYGVRATVSLFGLVMSAQLVEGEHRERFVAEARAGRRLTRALESLDAARSDDASLVSFMRSLSRVFEAQGGAFIDGDQVLTSGSAPEASTVLRLCQRLGELPDLATSYRTEAAYEEFDLLRNERPKAAGILALRVGASRWMMLFRDESVMERRWGGNPAENKKVGDGGLRPRESFEAYLETIEGRCPAWPEWTDLLVDQLLSGLSGYMANRERFLERSNKSLRDFAGVVAHEVRSQLQSPMLSMEMMEQMAASDPKLGELVRHGMESLRELREFTSEMLGFAEMGADSEECEPVDLNELMARLVTEFEDFADVDFDVGELPVVQGRPHLLQHVFSNLIRNAVIHAPFPDARRLTVEVGVAARAGRDGMIRVRDDGRGIPSELHAQVFEPRFRGSTNGARPGHGIGLAFVKQVVVQMGGRIHMESAPGDGTAFYLDFP